MTKFELGWKKNYWQDSPGKQMTQFAAVYPRSQETANFVIIIQQQTTTIHFQMEKDKKLVWIEM